MYIDSHCHFDFPPFEQDPDNWLKTVKSAGIAKLIVPSVAVSNWERIEKLAQQSNDVLYALGLHPVWQDEHQEQDLLLLEQRLRACPSQCVAVGECGLDFALPDARREWQLTLLERQLALATELDLPVILHCRKAHNELLQMLNRFPSVRGVIHAFSGSYELGMNYVRRGLYLGIGGTITYPRANKTRQAVAKLPLESMLLETDSPDMPIYGHQGKPNSPEKLIDIACVLAELKSTTVDNIAHKSFHNVQILFSLNALTSSHT
ncbi:TatD family hydrolase [Veronia pacifica]|uniref:Deoxyribonuclease YjjV n=1 Tax=Veronia pacifica TaxID=1080227 RepID=A0A1C3EK64_9GAMM|nr:TatD family hydrolase [Veronia pacifica]ODA33613.1 deoxyribonuclease YjjV [Veronia pacifica]